MVHTVSVLMMIKRFMWLIGSNHCILEWKRGARNDQVVAGGNRRGERNNQLSQPTDVIV